MLYWFPMFYPMATPIIMLSNVLRKKSLRQNNSMWLDIGVGVAGVSI